MRAFGKDRAPEAKAPARSIPAAVPTPLGPPVGCHTTPSDGIAYADIATNIGEGVNNRLDPSHRDVSGSAKAVVRIRVLPSGISICATFSGFIETGDWRQ